MSEMKDKPAVRPPPGFAPKIQKVRNDKQARLQVSFTPSYMMATSTPKITDVRDPKLIKSNVSFNVLNTLSGLLPSPICSQSVSKSKPNSTNTISPSIVLTIPKPVNYQFTGMERPFIPRAKVVPVDPTFNSVEQKQVSLLKTSSNVLHKTLTEQKSRKGSDASPTTLNPLTLVPFVQNSLPALQPVSPVRQMQMEIKAGMKPSIPVSLNYHQAPSQVQVKPAGLQTRTSEGLPQMRPILGRKFTESDAIKVVMTPGIKAGTNPTNYQMVPPAHSHHTLSNLAAQDSAIIRNVEKVDSEPIDLSTKPSNDYARVWTQMTTKTSGNNTESAKRSSSLAQLSSASLNLPSFIRDEKRFYTGDSEASCTSTYSKDGGNLVAPKTLNFDNSRKEDGESGHAIKQNHQQRQPHSLAGDEQQCEENPVEEKSIHRTAEAVPHEKWTDTDSKIAVVGNNSSSSTLPYEENPIIPENLSQRSSKDLDEFDSPYSDKDHESPQNLIRADTFLGIRGHALKLIEEDRCTAESPYPLETSEGLMDSVFEEDMIKANSNLVSPRDSEEKHFPPSSPLRLIGNNIWEGPNLNSVIAVNFSDSDSYVSDSEDGYLTCSTSLCHETAPESPVIDVLGKNYSGRGYSVYKRANTPTKVLKWLKHSSEDLHKDAIEDLVSAIQNHVDQNTQDIHSIPQYNRLVLKGIQHMLTTSKKLEEIVDTDDDIHSDSAIPSVVKAYINATTRCINKIALIMKRRNNKKVKVTKTNRSTTSGRKAKTKSKTSKAGLSGIKQEIKLEGSEASTIPEASESYTYEVLSHRSAPLIGAMDLVTQTPITGNRYWKKRMLRQNFGEDATSNSLKQAISKNTDQGIPECRKGLLSASFSDDDEEEGIAGCVPPKLTWTPRCKLQGKGLKLFGSEKKKTVKDNILYPYKKLKNPVQKGKRGKAKSGQSCSGKRKRDNKASPTGISPPNKNAPKQNQSSSNVVGNITSSNRRHFPYQAQCNRVIDTVYNIPESYPFREEFRNNEEPDYYKVIKYPMFFELVTSKLRQRLYYRLEDFVSDVRRVFWNTRHFYQEYLGESTKSCRTLEYCDRVEAFFESRLKSTFPFMDFSGITGSPQAEKTRPKTTDKNKESGELNVFEGLKVKGALRELMK